MPASADCLDEHLFGPDPEARVLLRRQVEGVADAPWAAERGVRGETGPQKRLRIFCGRQRPYLLRVSREKPLHVRLGALRTHLPRSVAVVAAHDADEVLAALNFCGVCGWRGILPVPRSFARSVGGRLAGRERKKS